MEKKRIEWLDYAKGIGIILVIYGHTYVPKLFNIWLCSFHMPLFFFLSGITFSSYQKYSRQEFVTKKFKSLIIPYVIFATTLVVWKFIRIVFEGGSFISVAKGALGIILQIRTTSYGPGVWFLPTLFVAEIIVYYMINICKNKVVSLLIASAILMLVGYIYCEYIDIKLPWGIDASLIASSYIIIGYLFKETMMNNFKKIEQLGFLFIIPNVIFAFVNYKILGRTIGMWSNNYGNFLYFVLSAVSGIIFIIWICNRIKSLKFVLDIGEHSIVYYGIHIIFIEIFKICISKIPELNVWVNETEIGKLVLGTISVIFTLIAVKFLTPLFEKLISIINKPNLIVKKKESTP